MTDAAEIVHHLETTYRAYAGAFNDGDMATVVRYIAAPYIMTIGGRPVMIAASDEAVRRMFDGSLADMKARGWVRSDFNIVRAWALSEHHGLLISDIRRFKADGSMLEKGRYMYTIGRAEPMWRITGVTDIAPPFTGPGDVPRT